MIRCQELKEDEDQVLSSLSLVRMWWPSQAWRDVDRVRALQSGLSDLSDAEIRTRARSLRWRMLSGEGSRSAKLEGFSLVCEAIKRSLGWSPYAVQIYAGLLLYDGAVVEMQTGEGKTLTAVGPACLRALEGRSCHVMTANEYLAQRDAEKMRPVYEQLGLTVSCVRAKLETPERRAAYDCDITYGTANEFGFDYLRDRLALNGRPEPTGTGTTATRPEGVVQRGRHFALIDEADSILLDDGRTPLIIALPTEVEESLAPTLLWAHATAQELGAGRDFIFDPKTRAAKLSEQGCRRVLLRKRPSAACEYDLETLFRRVETALEANWAFQRDREYLLKDDEVQIVDESTGRSLDGRRWQNGLHQAVEIKEGLPPSEDHGIAARITLQRFIRLYTHVCGMTGTAMTSQQEFRRLYNRRVRRIPTHRPSRRVGWPSRVFSTLRAKWEAVAEDVVRLQAAGRSILIGTPSILASEGLSACLTAAGIEHELLNARQDADEARIVSQAGHTGRVTIATNMAGRGTDIELEDDVRSNGGLHVIATEYCSSRRIDRQLVGRAARQGDPGSYQFFVSAEDELFAHWPVARRIALQQQAVSESRGELSARRWLPLFHRVQRSLERRHERERRQMLKVEKERWKIARRLGLDPCLDLVEET